MGVVRGISPTWGALSLRGVVVVVWRLWATAVTVRGLNDKFRFYLFSDIVKRPIGIFLMQQKNFVPKLSYCFLKFEVYL